MALVKPTHSSPRSLAVSFTRMFRPLQPGVRARRIDVGERVSVETKTLGTAMSFVLGMENLSRSGLLLSKGRNYKVPFQLNTLVEITVDPEQKVFERPVNALAKVVRFGEASPGQQASFGLRIIQIDTKDNEIWEKCVAGLEAWQEAVLPPAAETSEPA